MKYIFLMIITLALGASLAQANGFGLKLDKTVGDYIVNLDTNSYGLTDAEPVRFDFQLWNKDRTQLIDFDNVWVNITPKGAFDADFAGLVGKPEFGGVGMTYLFPKAGDYNLSVRFGKNGAQGAIETLAEASFPLSVAQDVGGTPLSSRLRDFVVSSVLGIVIGALGVFLLKRK